jgi:hypothetical protein
MICIGKFLNGIERVLVGYLPIPKSDRIIPIFDLTFG